MSKTKKILRLNINFAQFNGYSEERLDIYGVERDCVVIPSSINCIFHGRQSNMAYFTIRRNNRIIDKISYYLRQEWSKKNFIKLNKLGYKPNIIGNIYENNAKYISPNFVDEIKEARDYDLSFELDFRRFNGSKEGKRIINGVKENVIIIPCDINGLFKSHDEQQGYRASYAIHKVRDEKRIMQYGRLYNIMQICSGANREAMDNVGMETQWVGGLYKLRNRVEIKKGDVNSDYFENIFE